MTLEEAHGLGASVAAEVERRWAVICVAIVILLLGMAAFAGIHQASMPQARVETAGSKHAPHLG